jgi:ABC-type nitrate/sulfonate/bicarbonate transport system substrate-binding protein
MHRRLRHLFEASIGMVTAASLTAAGPSAVAGASSTPTPVDVGQISNSVAYFPIYVARVKHYFTKAGVSVAQPPLLGTGAKVAAALASGSIEVGGGVMTDAFNLFDANNNPELIAATVDSYYVDVIVGKSFHGPSVKASLKKRISALKGKKIGITGPGSGTNALIDYLFSLDGMNAETQATLVNLGSSASAAVDALKNGEVDALVFFQPVGQIAEAAGAGTIYISPANGTVPGLKGAINGTVYTTATELRQHRSAILGVIKGIGKAEKYIHLATTSSLVSLLTSYDSGMSTTVARSLVPVLKKEVPSTPKFTKKGYKAEVTVNVKGGLVKSAPSYGKVVAGKDITKALK